jgi:ATP-dependent RNA helicase DeaD
VIDSLKDGRLDIVVATDVAARGLDVPRITHVFNVDMPYDPESYVHRIGRTGRAGREGRALLLVTPRERRMLQVIERVTGQKVAEVRLPDAQAVLDARIKKLTNSLAPLVAEAESTHGDLLDRLTADLGCSPRALAAALLRKATNGQALTWQRSSVSSHWCRTTPRVASVRAFRGERPERGDRERRAPMPLAEGRVVAVPRWVRVTVSRPRTCWARSSTKVAWRVKPSVASRCVTASAWSSCRKMVWSAADQAQGHSRCR